MALLKYGFTVKVSRPSIGAVPRRPNSFHFPQRDFGRPPHVTKSSFQSSWFAKWTWHHYNKEEDAAYVPESSWEYKSLHIISNSDVNYTNINHKYGHRYSTLIAVNTVSQ